MRLHFMLVRRVPPVSSPVLLEVFEILQKRGHEVRSDIAEEVLVRPDRMRAESDLYILKSHTELTLSLAGVLHAQGARMLNPYLSCIGTQDKIVASRRLRAAGVPVPRSWVTGDLSLLTEILVGGPIIIKPYRGHRGAGISMVKGERDLATLPILSSPVIAQEYIEGTGEDLKVYVVGDHVFAVRKSFSSDSFTRPGRPCRVSGKVREISHRVGRAFGLGLYGMDIIESPDGPVVVDLNYFPGYKGVPDVAPLLADYIHAYAAGSMSLEIPDTSTIESLDEPTDQDRLRLMSS